MPIGRDDGFPEESLCQSIHQQNAQTVQHIPKSKKAYEENLFQGMGHQGQEESDKD